MKSSLASSSENCVLLIFISFFMVVFMADVMPELHCEPKPMAVTSTTDASFHFKGTGCRCVLLLSSEAGAMFVLAIAFSSILNSSTSPMALVGADEGKDMMTRWELEGGWLAGLEPQVHFIGKCIHDEDLFTAERPRRKHGSIWSRNRIVVSFVSRFG